jgi:hypothetical protein
MQRSGVYDPRVPWTFKEKGNDAGFVATMKSLLSKKAPSATFNAYIYAGRNRNIAFPNGGYICYSSTKPQSYVGKTYSKATALNRYQRYYIHARYENKLLFENNFFSNYDDVHHNVTCTNFE